MASSRSSPKEYSRSAQGIRKQRACEPCRKSKLRCDHNRPTCGRCLGRGLRTTCSYGSPPLRSRQNGAIPDETQAPYISIEPRDIPPSHDRNKTTATARTKQGYGEFYGMFCDEPERSGPIHAGFLGPTSYSAIFSEHQSQLDVDLGDWSRDSGDKDDSFISTVSRPSKDLCSIDLGVRALQQLPSQDNCEKLLDRFFRVMDYAALHEPTVRYAHRSFWSRYGGCLASGKRSRLACISEELCDNSQSVLGTAMPDNLEQWRSSFTDSRFRWETLGTLFAIYGLAAMSFSDCDLFLESQPESLNDRKKYASHMERGVEACVLLCDNVDACNDVKVLLLHCALILQGYCVQSGYLLWRRHGSLVAAITAMGLHREPESGRSNFPLKELRRRLFIATFVHDKIRATFMGRPPLLSRHYCNCALPLDLSDEDIMESEENLAIAKAKLDDNGWNQDGKVCSATRARAFMLSSLLRDEILEISLHPSSQPSEAIICELRSKCDQVYSQLPVSLRWKSERLASTSASSYYWQIFLHLEFLHSKFLLDKLQALCGQGDSQPLLDTARQLLDVILVLWKSRDCLWDYVQCDFDFLIATYGAPSAGVLAIELLKQSKTPAAIKLKLPRSEVVQNLSVFICCLDWVRETDSGFALCGRMRKIIGHILDSILDPSPSVPSPPIEATSPIDVDIPPLVSGPDDTDFLQWLDAIDWTKDPMMDLN